MRLMARRRRAAAAAIALGAERRRWLADTIALRAWCARREPWLVVGGGLASGAAASLLPLRPVLRLVSMLSSTAMLMLRFPLADFVAWREAARAREAAAAAKDAAS